MSIVPLNFSDPQHRAIIMKLCSRNSFYEDDVYAEVHRDVPKKMKDMLSAEQCDKLKQELMKSWGAVISRGYFIIDKEKGKNSVVGFVIYDIEKQTPVSSLLFLLVDKKYRNQSFGTTLMQKYMADIHELNIIAARVKSESPRLNEWYSKFHFKKHGITSCDSSQFELLHYFRING